MKTVYICSPYKGDEMRNTMRAISYCRAAIAAGVVPIAPHLYLTRVLNDDISAERETGIRIGIELLKKCDEVWVCGGTIFEGMAAEITAASNLHIPVRAFAAKTIDREVGS